MNEANAQKEKPPAPRVSVLKLLKDAEEVPKEKNVVTIDNGDSEEHHSKAEDSAALQDMRRLQLKKMVADYENYVDGKQNMKFENEDDIAAIRYAENNMGDFKLKSDLEHVRPINQQTNAKKKRNEMLLLKEAVFKQKMEFNKELLALRDIKMQICNQIREKNARIHEINNIMRVKDELLYVPPTFKDEAPEERDHVSDKDIEEHCQNLKRINELQKEQEKKGLDFGGMSTKSKPDDKNVSVQSSSKRLSLNESSRKEFDKLQRANVSAQARVFALSTLEQEEQDALQIKLKFQKSKLLENIELMISSFDNALQELRHKRFQLEINIKRADLKMITLYQELKVLRTMQPKEEALESRHVVKLAELTEISGKVSEQDKILEQKKQELHALNEKKKQLMEEFEELLGENHPSKDALLKIYMRKVKLSKGIDDEVDDNLDEDIDMDDSKGSEDDFDEDEVVEVCPPGCDQELYQKVCQIRERRTVEDALLQESNKQLDVAQREKESKLKKKKAIETALAGLEKEMEDFQKEKQNSLNQIDAVLTLYMHQLEHLPDGNLPDDLSQALVFSNTVINELKETIKDHGTETSALKKLQKELKKEHITLVRERKSRESKIADLEQRVTDVQMLKFGQIIDLEVLDTMSAKKDNEELKLQIKIQEAQNAAEVSKWNRVIDDLIDQIARAMKEHAACLHVTADLQESIQLLNKNMKQKAGCPYRDIFVEKKKAELEYDHLCKVVAVQKQRIEKLNQQLRAIQKERRKAFP